MSRRLPPQTISDTLICALAAGLIAAALAAGGARGQTPEVNASKVTTTREQEVTLLETGKPVERELRGGQSHAYGIRLEAGQLMRASVEQRGIDVVVSLFAPDGSRIAESDSPNGAHGLEKVSAVAELSGLYLLEVASLERDSSTGRYAVKLEELRAVIAQDKARMEAERALSQARLMYIQGTGDAPRKSITMFERALSIYHSVGDSEGEAKTLNSLGTAYNSMGEHRKALDNFEQALRLTRALRDRFSEATLLNNTGALYSDMGEYQKALGYNTQALALWEEIGDKHGVATALNNLGLSYYYLGDIQKALKYFTQSLPIFQETGDVSGEAKTLNNIGVLYNDMGEYQKALDQFKKALLLRKTVGDRRSEATTLNNIGRVYISLGDKEKALENLTAALALHRVAGDRHGEATTLNNLGGVYSSMGQKRETLDLYQQALSLYKEVGDRGGEATMLNNLGAAYSDSGEKQKALDYYAQALLLTHEVGDRLGEATALNNAGKAYEEIGNRQKALDYYGQALAIMRATGDQMGESTVLFSIGKVYESLRDLVKALDYYLQTIAIRERLRATLSSDQHRLGFDEESAELYQRAVLIYIGIGQGELAFNISERMRARNLLDYISRGRFTPRGQTEPGLAEREVTLRTQMSSLERSLKEERNKPDAKIDQNLLQQLEAQLADKQHEYEEVLTLIRKAGPAYNSLLGGKTLTLREVQGLLQPDTTLLSYLVTPSKTIVFVISKNSFQTVEINVNEGELFSEIREFRSFPTVNSWKPNKLRQLHQSLVAPVERYLKTRLVGIVAYGVLHYLPFSALSDGNEYFSEKHTIFYLPSASVLPYILRNRKSGDTLLAVAYSRPEGVPLLKYADSEVRSIAKTYGAQVLTGGEATEEKVRRLVGNYGILHLAACYELNTQSPWLSRILLGPSKNDDGALEVHEIYDLDLRKTDMVVLSGSQTQLGKQTGGDDLIGPEGAFIHAGASTTVGSLWNVDDETTSLLMAYFYKHLKQGVGKAEALRLAQAEVRAKYPHPYYWAAFVLTGDPGMK